MISCKQIWRQFIPAAILPCTLLAMAVDYCPAQNAAPNISNATEFLKWSMSKYADIKSFKADCVWRFGGSDSPTTSSRVVRYEQPNKYKIVSSQAGGFTMTSISDGVNTLDFSGGGLDQAMKSKAPKSISVAGSMYMQHPMFCGSMLYKFFGGPSSLSSLIDTAKQPVRFGKDTVVDGEACKTVKFYATGTYGGTEIAIRPTDGMVRRIAYDNEPLVAMMKEQLKGQPASASASSETYKNIVLNAAIPSSEFVITPPKGVKVQEMPMGRDSSESGPPVPFGSPAPDFEVAGMDGKRVKLSSFRGKTVLIDFWATWCPPCRKGLPETNKLHKELGPKGLVVMALSDEKASEVAPFIKKEGYTFPSYLDTTGAANKAYKISAIPTMAIIDKGGKLTAFMVGLHSPDQIRAALKRAGL